MGKIFTVLSPLFEEECSLYMYAFRVRHTHTCTYKCCCCYLASVEPLRLALIKFVNHTTKSGICVCGAHCRTPQCEAHNRAGAAGASGDFSLRLCLYVCTYVCLSVTSLRLKYTGLCIVYVPFGTCCSGCDRAMAWRSRSRTRKIEDDARTSPDVWRTVNCSTKG